MLYLRCVEGLTERISVVLLYHQMFSGWSSRATKVLSMYTALEYVLLGRMLQLMLLLELQHCCVRIHHLLLMHLFLQVLEPTLVHHCLS